jgi:hypothetical protein
MASRWADFQIVPKGGLNLDENPNAVREDELIEALNVWYRGASIGTRPGVSYETEADTFTAALTGPVQGGVDFRMDNDATRHHVVVSNGTIYDNGSGTTITKGAGVTVASGATRLWNFANHAEALYAAGGATTDTPWLWAGTGDATLLTILDGAGNAISPGFIFAKWKRLFACAFRRTSTGAISTNVASNPMTPRYTQLNQPLVWPTGNTFAGTGIGGLPTYGNEHLTGFSEYTDNDGDFLLLLTNRRLWAVQEDPSNPTAPFYISRKAAISFGCVSQYAFVSLGLDSGDAVYLSEHGIHSLRQSQQFGGREDKTLSWKIRALFRTINRAQLQYAVGSYFREEGVVIFAVPTGSDTFNSLLLILDVKGEEQVTAENARWTIARLGASGDSRKITTLYPARNTTGKWYLYGGTVGGDVFRFDDTSNADLSAAYESTFTMPWLDFGAPQREKTLGDLYLQLQPAGDYSAQLAIRKNFRETPTSTHDVDLPVEDGTTYGVGIYGADVYAETMRTNSQRIYAVGSGTNFSFKVSRSAASEPFYVAKLSGRVAGHGVARGVE